jgi:hypothetical protein
VEIEVDGLTDLSSLLAEIEISAGASISPNPDEPRDFTGTVFYTVTAQDSVTTQEWEIIVEKAPIVKEDQVITFNLPDTLYQDQSPFPLEATVSSGLRVRFSVENGLSSVFNDELVITSEGTVVVKAFQAGNDTLNYAEVVDTVTVLGSYDISAIVLRPDDSPLEEGLGKLFKKDGGLFQKKKFTDGDLKFTNVRSGEYIIQIIPVGNITSDIFPTYYNKTQFNKEAFALRISNDLRLTMYMKGKNSASTDQNGNGQIKGKVVKSQDQSNSRISTGEASNGEGISELIIYLLKESTNEILRSAVTDSVGNFNMSQIPDDIYEILIDIPGLEQSATSFQLPYDRKNNEMNLTIFMGTEGIVDVDVSTVLGAKNSSFGFNLYPNPTPGTVYLHGYEGDEQEVSIISAKGEIVKSVFLTSEREQLIDLKDLDAGVYYLKLESGKEERVIKVIKK